MNEIFLKNLRAVLLPENILIDEILNKHTTFKIGGSADYFVKLQDAGQLKNIISLCKEYNIPYRIIGNGSNILFSDDGYRGLIIKNDLKQDIKIKRIIIDGKEKASVISDSGIMLSKFSKVLAEHGLAGYEFASGIPGTLGGAVVMNAGAYGGEIGDFIQSVKVLDKDGRELVLSKEQLLFSYRHSIIKDAAYIVLSAAFILNKGDKTEIFAKMEEYNNSRKEKQPLEYPSAGSAFKRPAGNYAGKLIMEAGLAGYKVGGAEVSQKHCGFVINTGDARASDVKQLLDKVRLAVKEHSGYELETEIEFIGDFN